ncbi:MAG: hypothetical protein ACODAU_12000, partial [Myxococcota bacterium]
MRAIRGAGGLGVLLLAAVAAGCGGKGKAEVAAKAEVGARSKGISGGDQPTEDAHRCDADAPDREVSEYDTSGDDIADVRKVFKQIGDPPETRLVLICREADLNSDGVKDVVRYYDDEGSPVREEADRDFDGQMDIVTYYDGGRIIRQELDTNADGRVDAKVFYEGGKPLRAERDQAGRSTENEWHPDTWEYYEAGRVVRIGFDIDGDGQVDRWDRNDELKGRLEARRNGGQGGSGQAGGDEEGAGGDGEASGEDASEDGDAAEDGD